MAETILKTKKKEEFEARETTDHDVCLVFILFLASDGGLTNNSSLRTRSTWSLQSEFSDAACRSPFSDVRSHGVPRRAAWMPV